MKRHSSACGRERSRAAPSGSAGSAVRGRSPG
jgi:hypothetical protein